MIKFEIESKRKVDVYNDDKHIITLEMVPSTITNKYFIITNYIENISKEVPEFDKWFESFITQYNSFEDKLEYLEINVPKIKEFSDKYLDSKGFDLSKFVNESKAKKNTIFFTRKDVEAIIRFSCYLKVFSIISNSENMILDQRLYKKVYNLLASDIDSELISKIFNVVKTKTYKYQLTDKYMWDYIKMVQCKSIEQHVIHIFNFIMNNIIILCEEDKNPITYFVTVIDESVRWFLRSVYKSSIVYDDSVSTEDIQSTNVDNLKTYCYNDTLGRLKGIAFNQIQSYIEPVCISFNDDDNDMERYILNFQRRLENVKYISPFCEFLVFPVISKITNIPYNHLKTLSPEHSILLSVFLQRQLGKIFDQQFKILFSMLSYYPKTQPSIITTYKLKNISLFINLTNSVSNFLGFNSKLLLSDILGNFIGKVSRLDFVNIFDGKELGGLPLSKLETDLVEFFVLFFAGKLDSYFEKIKKNIELEF